MLQNIPGTFNTGLLLAIRILFRVLPIYVVMEKKLLFCQTRTVVFLMVFNKYKILWKLIGSYQYHWNIGTSFPERQLLHFHTKTCVFKGP